MNLNLSPLQTLSLTLRRMKGERTVAGDAGEALTELCLNEAGLSWIKSVQTKGSAFSTQLRRLGGKRPDYLVGDAGALLLLDSKCLSPTADTGLEFALEQSEVDRLNAAGKIFGAEVAVIVWSRKGQTATFFVDRVSRFSTPTTITSDGEVKPALSAAFRADEAVVFQL